jgi:hypothetical protein
MKNRKFEGHIADCLSLRPSKIRYEDETINARNTRRALLLENKRAAAPLSSDPLIQVRSD